jgi:acetyltransferase-like isoleucine patch superfamily enzyme
MKIAFFLNLIFKKCKYLLFHIFYKVIAVVNFYINNISVPKKFNINGVMKIHVSSRGKAIIGESFSCNSGNNYNIIGRQQKTIFWVDGFLDIGIGVGMSSTAIICKHRITIEDFVTIGGGTVVYDSDFHSISPEIRKNRFKDLREAKCEHVIIGKNAFIGAHCTILKGVKIGENSVLGACSVISSDVPKNEIWAGNPARFIRKIEGSKN